jgi:hypothetical protein
MTLVINEFVWYFERTQRFEDWISFRPQVNEFGNTQ